MPSYAVNGSFISEMVILGILYVALSGICNGVFSAPMKIIPRWKWENISLVFILTSCVAMPPILVFSRIPDVASVLREAPDPAITAALVFGFGWGFGAILSASAFTTLASRLPIAS